jgi:hypothetical protein
LRRPGRNQGGPSADGQHRGKIRGHVRQDEQPLHEPAAQQHVEVAENERERKGEQLELGEAVGLGLSVEKKRVER